MQCLLFKHPLVKGSKCRDIVLKEAGCSQNLKQVLQIFIKAFCVDDVTLTSQLMTSYRKTNIASEKVIKYRVSSPSNHQCCQINITV